MMNKMIQGKLLWVFNIYSKTIYFQIIMLTSVDYMGDRICETNHRPISSPFYANEMKTENIST